MSSDVKEIHYTAPYNPPPKKLVNWSAFTEPQIAIAEAIRGMRQVTRNVIITQLSRCHLSLAVHDPAPGHVYNNIAREVR